MFALAALLLATGCGTAPPTSPPQGVDGLEVPTASPDPADFVDTVDNPWLPLRAGARWTYATDDGETVSISVTGTRETAGITATVVAERGAGRDAERLYAQDRAGNVWLLGETTGGAAWQAGVDGATAGLAMAASPRLGDGYRLGYAEGVAEDVAEVVALGVEVDVEAGSFDDALLVEQTSTLDPAASARRFHVEGVGLVLLQDQESGESLELVDHTEG